jgi:uncharacterized cofD-like protein
MNPRMRAGAQVNIWLAVLAAALLLLGSGITLAVMGRPISLIPLGISAILGLSAWWQLSQSRLGLTLSLVGHQTPGELLVTRQSEHGLPDVVVFSGHMGLLIILKALRDSVDRLVAVPAPGSDYRTIAGLLRASHQDTRVVSATAENAQLCARLNDGNVIVGSDAIEQANSASIDDLFLSSDGTSPASTEAWPLSHELEEAVRAADMFVFGPGSLFTSVLPSLLVPKLRERIAASGAPTVFICNVMTEPGRTDGWAVGDFIRTFTQYAGFAPQFTIVNRSYPGSNMLSRYEVTGSFPIMVTPEEHIDSAKIMLGGRFPGSTTLNIGGSTVVEADVIEVATESRMTLDTERGTTSEHTVAVIRHDPEKLARVLRNIISQTRSHALAG